MSAKVILVFCAQALFIQVALSACAGRPNLGAGLATYGLSPPVTAGCAGPVLLAPGCSGIGYNGIGYGNAGVGYGSGLGYGSNFAIEVVPTSGGALPVSSTSSISPNGLSITSENVFDGNLYVGGELPFVGAVALEGVLPSGGAGAASYSCGNGVTAIETIAPSAAATIAPAAAYGVGIGAYGAGIGAYGAGIGAYGAGIGAYGAGNAPLLSGAGNNGPVAGIVAPIDGCYPTGIYY